MLHYINIHQIFDLISYLIAFYVSYNIKPLIKNKSLITFDKQYEYYIVLIVGIIFGAFFFGTLNVYFSMNKLLIGKSVLGAIFGGVLSSEIYKYLNNIKGSTGSYFVPSLAIGISIGRIGCYLSGLEDYTYGVETTFILGHDFGDGVIRHPVQLYESFTMFIFFIYSILILKLKENIFKNTIFYQFILFYASQRFIWEFLKPYKDVLFGINLFQILCLILIFYSILFLNINKKNI